MHYSTQKNQGAKLGFANVKNDKKMTQRKIQEEEKNGSEASRTRVNNKNKKNTPQNKKITYKQFNKKHKHFTKMEIPHLYFNDWDDYLKIQNNGR